MRRRQFIALAGAATLWPFAARAQQDGKVHRVGILWPVTPSANDRRLEAFRRALAELGYVEGRNLIIVTKGPEPSAQSTQLIATVDELVREKVDIILTVGTSPTRAAKSAAGALPIVMTFVSDPIGSGFAASLARPGGTITGLTNFGPELSSKWLELIKELSPNASRIGVLYDSAVEVLVKGMKRAAISLGAQLHAIETSNNADSIESSLKALMKNQVEAMIVTLPPRSGDHRIVDFALANRVPSVYWWREYVEAGGLVYYGPSIDEMYRRAAAFVDKIFKGAKPAELPLE